MLKIKSKDFSMEMTFDGEDTPQVATSTSVSSTTADQHLAVALIALALSNYGDGEVHDEESGRITILPYQSEWNAKSFGFANYSRVINRNK